MNALAENHGKDPSHASWDWLGTVGSLQELGS
jgi:hypothetical protein